MGRRPVGFALQHRVRGYLAVGFLFLLQNSIAQTQPASSLGTGSNPAPQIAPAPSAAPANSAPTSPNPAPPDNATPAPAPSGGQAPEQDNGVFVFHKEVEEVMLHATVVDDQRHLIPNLDKSAFEVFEDGKPQPITSFHRDDVPVAMGIVIDNSGSMREKRDKVNEAVLNLIRQDNSSDEVFVVNFSREPYLDQDFTGDINLVRTSLDKISMQGSTALYDAIVASAVHLHNNPRIENRVLLVVTDGRDNASRETLQEARLRLQQQNGPTLYAIGLMGDDLQPQDRQVLDDLAASTGGAAFFPGSLDELNGISRAIGHDIHSRYTIGYKSSNAARNGKYRTIQVQARAPGYAGLVVRTRKGYYPGEVVR